MAGDWSLEGILARAFSYALILFVQEDNAYGAKCELQL
jgi:hypothetical protein